MLKKSTLKAKKKVTLHFSPLKGGRKGKGLSKGNTFLRKESNLTISEDYELKKQSDKAKTLWEDAREKCIARDKGKCQLCGKPGTQVHHIHLRSKRKDLLYNLNNLILLCDKCHAHRSNENYMVLTTRIAKHFGLTIEELLKLAEKEE